LRERRDDIAKLLHYVFYGHIYSSSYSTQKPLQAAGNLTQEIKRIKCYLAFLLKQTTLDQIPFLPNLMFHSFCYMQFLNLASFYLKDQDALT
jgi:hypothetical protein